MTNAMSKSQQDISVFLIKKFKTYFSTEFDYIEYPEDMEDLELAMCSEEMLEETLDEVMQIISETEDSYDIETTDTSELEEDVCGMIEDIFYKVRDEEIDICREKIEMGDMMTEMEEYEDY